MSGLSEDICIQWTQFYLDVELNDTKFHENGILMSEKCKPKSGFPQIRRGPLIKA